jgi:glutathione reductase (NADPH)
LTRSFDVVVVGTGSAGTAAATGCRAGGLSVAIVDDKPFGGTCALRGCDPKKVLVGAGELVDWARRMHAKGVVTQELHIDWPALMRFKRTFTDPVTPQRERLFSDVGVAMFRGSARFTDANSIEVDGDVLQASSIVIASGAMPVHLGIPGEEHVITSTQFLDLDRLPESIVFIGGGYISMEFAHLSARAGAKACVLDRGDRPLRGFDPDLVARLVAISQEVGIEMQVETAVMAVEKRDGVFVVRARRGSEDLAFPAELVVHGGGRVPDLDGLALENAGIVRTKKGVQVNEYLQSVSNPIVYAAGDAADGGGLPLTPVAGTEGEIVAENILKGNHRTADFSGLVSIVYTIPALASVGLTEAQIVERGIAYSCSAGDSSDWYTSRRLNAQSYYKVLVDESGLMLGAHLLGPYAEELANLFSLMIRARVPAHVAKDALFGYPTAASDFEYMFPEG